jgi:hypothetical protein
MDPALRRSAAHKPSTWVRQHDPPYERRRAATEGPARRRYLPSIAWRASALARRVTSLPAEQSVASLSRAEAALADTARICGQPTVRHPRCAGLLLSFRAEYGGVRVPGPASRGKRGPPCGAFRRPLPGPVATLVTAWRAARRGRSAASPRGRIRPLSALRLRRSSVPFRGRASRPLGSGRRSAVVRGP